MASRGSTAKIDLQELEKLCALQCTDEEIAFWFGVSTRTIERRRKVQKFADVMGRGKARGRISIRRAQMRMLEDGNATMGVWLGKQYLGQVDQLPPGPDAPQVVIMMPMLPPSPESSVINLTPGDNPKPGDAAQLAPKMIDVNAEPGPGSRR